MGTEIVGPASTLEQAQRLLDERPIDMAVLDIKLRDAVSYRFADELVARRVPIVLATCFDAEVIPTRFAGMPRCVKLASSEEVASPADDRVRSNSVWRRAEVAAAAAVHGSEDGRTASIDRHPSERDLAARRPHRRAQRRR